MLAWLRGLSHLPSVGQPIRQIRLHILIRLRRTLPVEVPARPREQQKVHLPEQGQRLAPARPQIVSAERFLDLAKQTRRWLAGAKPPVDPPADGPPPFPSPAATALRPSSPLLRPMSWPSEEPPSISPRSKGIHDITLASNENFTGSTKTTINGYSAATGYDLATGIGSPQANNLVPYLASL